MPTMVRAPSFSTALAGAVLLPSMFITFIVSSFGRDWYDSNVLPHIIDFVCSRPAFMEDREKIVPMARGRVLEIGIGSGINLPLYDTSKVTKIVGVDPSGTAQAIAGSRIAALETPVEMLPVELFQLGAEDDSFDDIVCTFTLCTIPDVSAALREMRRVLKPGGRFLFVEHGQAPVTSAALRAWQTRLNTPWGALFGGCNLDRDIPALIEDAGFNIRELKSGYSTKGAPPVVSYLYHGWAD